MRARFLVLTWRAAHQPQEVKITDEFPKTGSEDRPSRGTSRRTWRILRFLLLLLSSQNLSVKPDRRVEYLPPGPNLDHTEASVVALSTPLSHRPCWKMVVGLYSPRSPFPPKLCGPPKHPDLQPKHEIIVIINFRADAPLQNNRTEQNRYANNHHHACSCSAWCSKLQIKGPKRQVEPGRNPALQTPIRLNVLFLWI